jgi:hypothetical protein
MSYLPNEPVTFINIKLTDAGRQLLSLGQLTFDQYAYSDREINYGIDRNFGTYSIESNRILAPRDNHPSFSESFDGTALQPLVSVNSATQTITASTEQVGFFTGSTNAWAIDSEEVLGYGVLDYSGYPISGDNKVFISGGTYFPNSGDLMYVPWEPPQNSGSTLGSPYLISSGNPTNHLWYRVLSADTGTSIVTVDRPVPDFGGYTPKQVYTYFYPFNGVEDYYGSASTVMTQVWNMNIIRTSSVEGTDATISGYTTYGSIEYNGTKYYLGFRDDKKTLGVVHYSNEYTGNTYAEQFVERSVEINIPNIMWHRYPSTTFGTTLPYGLTLTDSYGNTVLDTFANANYRELRDTPDATGKVVGRVYHSLKLIVITDEELLNVLTYKANRNYTLPPLNLETSVTQFDPCNSSIVYDTTGLLESGYTYFVTYILESDSYAPDTSYGYPSALPCGYVQRIEPSFDTNGNPLFLKASFPSFSFPYLRGSSEMTSLSGTGWSANKAQILVNKVDTTTNPNVDFDTVPTDGWVRISDGVGSGIFTGSSASTTISSSELNSKQFIISKEDYLSGTTYTLDSDFYSNADYLNESGLTFGNESFFFGTVKTSILATVYKTVLTTQAPDTQYNSSENPSFDGTLDANTYITEIGIFNSAGTLVAVGKFTYPVKKNPSRYIMFQLEHDF